MFKKTSETPLEASFSFSRSWVHRGVSISSSSSLARRAALSEDVERAKAYLMGGPRPTADGAPAAAPSSPSSSPAPYKWALLFDCDGVIWKGDSLIDGVPATLEMLRKMAQRDSNDADAEAEKAIKMETKATIRCYPLDAQQGIEEKKCFYSGRPATHAALFARAF